MLDPSPGAAFVLRAAHVVNACRQFERRVEAEGQMIARLLSGIAQSAQGQQPDGNPSPSLHGAYLEHLQELAAAVQSLRLVLEELMATAVSAGPSSTATRRAPILVVDDHDDTRELIASTLRLANFDVITANNGLEGLLVANTCRPALIVMDVQMPILTGIEATRLLKATATMSAVPVIAHTARPDGCQRHEPELFAHVLPKPTHPDVLLALVKRFVPVDAPPPAARS